MWNRLKENKWRLIISSIVILLPMIIGFALWNQFPEQMTMHWGADAVADGFGDRLTVILTPPLVLLAAHWICAVIACFDRSNDGKNRKVQALVFWIIPVISWMVNGMIYALGLGWTFDPRVLAALVFGFLFLIIGNYLPKCQQNRTIGIKMPWTLANEENWNATHRFAGRVWMIGGVLLLASAFLPQEIFIFVMLGIVFLAILIPMLYSYLLWKRMAKEGKVPKKPTMPSTQLGKTARGLSITAIVVILLLVGIVMVTGEVGISYDESSFTLKATYGSNLTVDYERISEIELVESYDAGSRVYGFASARLNLGQFQNEEFGTYTLYAYTGAKQAVIVRCDEQILVIAVGDGGETRAVYDTLLERIEH